MSVNVQILDLVGIDVSRTSTVKQTARERLEDDLARIQEDNQSGSASGGGGVDTATGGSIDDEETKLRVQALLQKEAIKAASKDPAMEALMNVRSGLLAANASASCPCPCPCSCCWVLVLLLLLRSHLLMQYDRQVRVRVRVRVRAGGGCATADDRGDYK